MEVVPRAYGYLHGSSNDFLPCLLHLTRLIWAIGLPSRIRRSAGHGWDP